MNDEMKAKLSVMIRHIIAVACGGLIAKAASTGIASDTEIIEIILAVVVFVGNFLWGWLAKSKLWKRLVIALDLPAGATVEDVKVEEFRRKTGELT